MHRAAVGGDHAHALQVRQPATTGLVVGVADVISSGRALATNFALTGHDGFSLVGIQFSKKHAIISPSAEKSSSFDGGSRETAGHATHPPAPAGAGSRPPAAIGAIVAAGIFSSNSGWFLL
jgi:hypothetical protein